MEKYVFFRVDDVCIYSKNLMKLTDIFVGNKIPASYQVIPKLLESRTVTYLNEDEIKKYISDIGQHGYQHQSWGFGEFNCSRSYEEQRYDITLGLEIIRTNFADTWNGVFSFPWGQFDKNTLKVLSENNFKVYSKQFRTDVLSTAAYPVLRLTKKEHFRKHNISYHKLERYNLRELSICIDFNKEYKFNTFKTYNQIIKEYEKAKKVTNYIGFLLHPNHIDSNKGMEVIEKVIKYLKQSKSIQFATISDIAQLLDKKETYEN